MAQQEIRDLEVDPNLYYPKDYHPQLLPNWPIAGDLVVPAEKTPETAQKNMGKHAREVEELRKANGLPPQP